MTGSFSVHYLYDLKYSGHCFDRCWLPADFQSVCYCTMKIQGQITLLPLRPESWYAYQRGSLRKTWLLLHASLRHFYFWLQLMQSRDQGAVMYCTEWRQNRGFIEEFVDLLAYVMLDCCGCSFHVSWWSTALTTDKCEIEQLFTLPPQGIQPHAQGLYHCCKSTQACRFCTEVCHISNCSEILKFLRHCP